MTELTLEEVTAARAAMDAADDMYHMKQGLESLRASIKFLEEQFIGDPGDAGETCDGTHFGCVGCDAARLRVELLRIAGLVEELSKEE